MFEVKSVTVDNGGKIKTEYELYLNGLLIGTSKLHCDAVLLGKQLDRELKLAYHRGCKTLERMIEAQELELEMQTKRFKKIYTTDSFGTTIHAAPEDSDRLVTIPCMGTILDKVVDRPALYENAEQKILQCGTAKAARAVNEGELYT